MHKDRLKKQEIHIGLLPSANAIEIIDYYAQGKSQSDVQGIVRVDSNKLSIHLIKTVYSHIKIIEDTMFRMLDGTSIVYNPPMLQDKEGNDTELAFVAKKIPTTIAGLIKNIMFTIGLDSKGFTNVYDADFTELTSQVSKVVANVIAAQSGTFDELRAALKQ